MVLLTEKVGRVVLESYAKTDYLLDDDAAEVETFQSDNCLTVPQPRRLDLGSLHSGPVLDSGQDLKLPLLMHVPRVGDHDLCLLVVYRQVCAIRDVYAFHHSSLDSGG